MKIVLIMVKGDSFKYNNLPIFLRDSDCLTMATLVAIIKHSFSDIKIEFYDETIEKIPKESIEADLIGISAITPAYHKAKALSEYFRGKGIPTFVGGIHATLVPEECAEDFDSVISGLANESLVELINDFKNGEMKKIYRQNPNMSFENFVHPKRYLYKRKNKKAHEINTVQATYGCPNICEFCVQPHVCNGYHQRPVEDVLKEIREIDSTIIEFYDPNITKDLDYLKKLCTGLEFLGKNWRAPSTISIASNEENLKMLQKSGCKQLLIGFESIEEDSIDAIHKGFNNIEKYKDAVSKLHKYGIKVMGSFVLGLDGDTKNTEKNLLKFINKAHIDFPRFTINTPYPGTEYYRRMKEEDRIICDDFRYYDCAHCVIKPQNLTPEQVEKMQKRLWKKSYTLINVIKRLSYIKSPLKLMYMIPLTIFTGIIFRRQIFKTK